MRSINDRIGWLIKNQGCEDDIGTEMDELTPNYLIDVVEAVALEIPDDDDEMDFFNQFS